MIKKDKDVIKIILVLFIYFFISTIISYLFKLFNFRLNMSNMEFIVQLILFIIVFIIYKKEILKDKKEFENNYKEYLLLSLKLFLMLLLVKALSAYITVFISDIFKVPIDSSENQEAIISLLKSFPISMFIASVFLAPFTEEIIFRLGIKKIFKSDLGFILVSGFLFGLMHIFPTDIDLTLALIQSITYVSLGCLLAYYYVRYDNIYIIIIIHALNNLLSILATFALL